MSELKRYAGINIGVELGVDYYLCEDVDKRIAELEGLVAMAKCPDCDGSGAYYDGMGEVCQCRWCDEVTEIRKALEGKQ